MITVLFACEYGGPYPGNFIPSLSAFQSYLEGQTEPNKCRIIYAFPQKCKERKWCKKMLEEGQTVYFYGEQSDSEFLEDVFGKEHFSIIHTHFEAFGRSVFGFKLRHPSVSVIWHVHSDFSNGKATETSLKQKLKNLVKSNLATMVSVSPHLKMPNGYVVPNAIDCTRIPKLSEKRSDFLCRKLGLPEDSKIVLCFGWSKETKGVDIACGMMDFLPETIKDKTYLCIVMPKSEENEKYIRAHSESADKIKILEATDEVFNYHLSADIMLSSSKSEAFSYTVLEALSVGTQVVSSDIPGVQWCKKYGNAAFFKSEDAEDCARAVCECMLNDSCKENLRIAKQVQQDCAITKWCESLFDIYKTTGKFK